MVSMSSGSLTVGTLSDFRTQDTRVVGRENGLNRGVKRVLGRGVVSGVEKAGQIAL